VFTLTGLQFGSNSCPSGNVELHIHNLTDASGQSSDIEQYRREVFMKSIDFITPSN
jgi:hypothetical protein